MTLSDRLRALAKRTALDSIGEELLAIAENEIDDFTEAEKFRCEQSKQLRDSMEAAGDFETEAFGFAQELVTQYGGDHIDDNAEVFKIHVKDLYVIMKMLGYGRKAHIVTPDELPGMWDHSDLVGGETDTAQATSASEKHVSVNVLSNMVKPLDSLDRNHPGFHEARGWNAALRQAMDYARPVAQVTPQADPRNPGWCVGCNPGNCMGCGIGLNEAQQTTPEPVTSYTIPTPDDSFTAITYQTNDIGFFVDATEAARKQKALFFVNGFHDSVFGQSAPGWSYTQTRRVDENTVDIGRVIAFADERATPEPTVTYATVRDAEDGLHIECRFSDGQKFAAVTVAQGFDNLAHRIETMLNGAQQATPEPVLFNGLTESETNATASVMGLTATPPQQAAGEPVGEPFGWWFTEDPDVFCMPGSGFRRYPNKPQHTVECIPLYTRPAPGVPEDAEVDRILSTPIPGGSAARDWFLPHETPKGLANVRDVVRAMLAAAQAKGGEQS